MRFVKNNINLENVKLKKTLFNNSALIFFLTKFYDPYEKLRFYLKKIYRTIY